MSSSTPVIDYEGSHYKTDFWVNQGREYEDRTERLLLKRLLPPSGKRIIEIGAGFGRLADLYTGYEQIILFDYSRSLLQEAVKQWGNDPRFVFVAGNVYELPFADGAIDTLVMVRVMHHLANVSQALEQLHRVIHSGSVAVVEYANKRNLKSILRWVLGKQSWSPFGQEPYEFVALNFDFHPEWMMKQFSDVGFTVQQRLAVSHFRLALLKQLLPTEFLAQIDNHISIPSGWYPLSPSVFVKVGVTIQAPSVEPVEARLSHRQAQRAAERLQTGDISNIRQVSRNSSVVDLASLFQCPNCGNDSVGIEKNVVYCSQCDTSYQKKGAIWDFKEKM